MVKKNKNQFVSEAISVHGEKYDYSKVEYINSHAKVCIICPEHGEFWQIPSSHMAGCGCAACMIKDAHEKTKKTTEQFIQQAKIIHGDKFDYSKVEYNGNKTKVCIICPKHGEFWMKPNSHLCGQGCPNCRKNKSITKEEFLKKSIEVHGDRYDYSKVEYKNATTKVCIICPIHGEFWQKPVSHMKGQGCLKCGASRRAEKKKLTTDVFIKRAKDKHGDKYDYSKVEYVNANTKVCIICPEHGEFWQKPFDHLGGRGCYVCNRNGGQIEESLYQYFLSKYNIVERNVKFDWLGRQSIDIYLPEYKIGIEYQGEQHFLPFNYMGGEDGLKHRKELDELKNKLCRENGVLLLYVVPDKYKTNDLIYNDKNTYTDAKDICSIILRK